MKIRHKKTTGFDWACGVLLGVAVLHLMATDTAADPCVWVPRVLGF